jgi:MULE transposase domain
VGFAFLPDQTEPTYIWALKKIKELYSLISPTVALDPGTISTDCDQALRNAISEVFPESGALLCLWHANKNIQQHCKPKFTSTEAYNEFFEAWLGLVSSPDIPEYQSRLLQFLTRYSDTQEHNKCAEYVKNTWLRPGRAEALVQAWTNQYPHFGVTVTSRLVPF